MTAVTAYAYNRGMYNQDSELEYVGSQIGQSFEPKNIIPEDEAHKPALERVLAQVMSDLAFLSSIDSLNISEKTTEFSVKKQVAINKEVAQFLLSYKVLLEETLDEIKEAQNG